MVRTAKGDKKKFKATVSSGHGVRSLERSSVVGIGQVFKQKQFSKIRDGGALRTKNRKYNILI